MDEIVVTPTSTFDEYLFAQRTLANNAIPSLSRVARYALGALLGAAIGFGLVAAPNPAFIFLVVAIAAYIVFSGLTARMYCKTLYKRWSSDPGPMYFSDAGVRFDSHDAKVEFTWDFFDRLVTGGSSYVLVAKSGGFVSVPKRDVPPEKSAALQELLDRKLSR